MNIDTFLHALTSYFVVIDPIGAALIFHGLTSTSGRRQIRHLALRSALISAVIAVLFGFAGEALFSKLGISIEALRVSGGLLLFYTAFCMITRGETGREWQDGPDADIAVFPMAIPLLSGPGCLTLTILLFSQSTDVAGRSALVMAIVLVYLFTWLALVAASRIQRMIGRTGDNILRRLLGVILAALSIQFIADGIRQIVAGG